MRKRDVLALAIVALTLAIWIAPNLSPSIASASSLMPDGYWMEVCPGDFSEPVCKLLRLYVECPPSFPEEEAAFRLGSGAERVVPRFKDYEFLDVFQATWRFRLNYRWLGFSSEGGDQQVIAVGLFSVVLVATCPYWPCTEVKAVGMLTRQTGDDAYDEALWRERVAEWERMMGAVGGVED